MVNHRRWFLLRGVINQNLRLSYLLENDLYLLLRRSQATLLTIACVRVSCASAAHTCRLCFKPCSLIVGRHVCSLCFHERIENLLTNLIIVMVGLAVTVAVGGSKLLGFVLCELSVSCTLPLTLWQGGSHWLLWSSTGSWWGRSHSFEFIIILHMKVCSNVNMNGIER